MATILHAVCGYVLLTLVVRVLIRRPGAQMTLAEFVLIFLLGGVIILSTVGNDRSMTNCVCAAIAIGSMHRLVSWAMLRYPAFGTWLVGTPLVLVSGGEWRRDILERMNLSEEDVMASARLNGLKRLDQIEYAVLERNGGISIIGREKDDEE